MGGVHTIVLVRRGLTWSQVGGRGPSISVSDVVRDQLPRVIFAHQLERAWDLGTALQRHCSLEFRSAHVYRTAVEGGVGDVEQVLIRLDPGREVIERLEPLRRGANQKLFADLKPAVKKELLHHLGQRLDKLSRSSSRVRTGPLRQAEKARTHG